MDRALSTTDASAPEVLEVVVFTVRQGKRDRFAEALARAADILRAARGYRRHQFGPCVEDGARFALVVWWATLEDHTVVFRQSADYPAWRAALREHIDGDPSVEHFRLARGLRAVEG